MVRHYSHPHPRSAFPCISHLRLSLRGITISKASERILHDSTDYRTRANRERSSRPTREVLARRERGQGNNVELKTGRSYAQIFRQNTFTFINNILFFIGAVLVSLGRFTDAVAASA